MVVSELAKSSHKNSRKGAGHVGTPALARMVAAVLAAGAMTWGIVPGVSWAAADNTPGSGDGVAIGTGSNAPKAENVAIGKGASISYSGGVGQPSTGDIVIGGGAHTNNYIDQGGGIAIGANSFVENMVGGLERSFDFKQAGYKSFWVSPYGLPKDPTKMVTGVAIGQNTYARSGSIMLGTHNYKGDLGDVTVDSVNTKAQNMSLFSTTLGANSYSNGLFSSVTGAYSIASSDYNGGENASKNFGATITGSLNSIESATSSSEYSGVANSIVGVANRTSNSNGSLIFGAGNEIQNSITDISAPTSGGDSAKALQDSLMEAVQNSKSGGATLVIGGGNKANYTQKTQILGVANTITGTESHIAMYNMVDGYQNTVTEASHVKVLGQNVTINQGADSNTVIGDYRIVAEKQTNNVIIGNADEKNPITTEKKETVILGYNSNAKVDGGVAIGSGSIANVGAGQKGYYVKHDQRSEEGEGYPFQDNENYKPQSAWISRAGAVSVGDTTNADQSKWITRQITGVAAGTKDTDAVNVAQLKNSQTRFYSIYDPGDDWLGIFPQIPNWEKYKNADNQGAQGYYSMAAGFGTSTGGIASTVIGSMSKIDNKWTDGGPNGFQGATAVSVGTLNFNLSDQVTDEEVNSDDPRVIFQSKENSGVANSIVGQGNLTKNSNGALIYGAGNIVTDSYRRVVANGDNDLESLTNQDMESLLSNPEKAIKTLGKIVDISGGKVMVMGGGNVVDKAYDSQVMGVGNTVVGDAINFEYKESPEVSNLPENTADEQFLKEASRDADVWTQYMGSIRKQGTLLNLVDGYYSTLKNGQNDYLIGTANEVTGDDASKNKSNIVFGDYHKLNNGNNNIIIGSADGAVVEKAKGYHEDYESGIITSQEITGQKQHTENLEDAVMIGHNADVQKNGGVALGAGSVASVGNGGVALGAGSVASVDYRQKGYDFLTKAASTSDDKAWKSSWAAVSIGDSTHTRQITNLAAGFNDTDAVNVAQLKAVAEKIGPAMNFVAGDGISIVKKDGVYTISANIKGGSTPTDDVKVDPEKPGEGGNTSGSTTDTPVTPVEPGNTGNTDNPGNTGNTENPGNTDNPSNGSGLIITAETKPTHFGADSGEAIAVKPGETLAIKGDTSNITTTASDHGIIVSLKKDIAVDSVTAGDTKMTSDGLTITGGPSVTQSGINAGDKKITNVADGIISKDSKDAINGSQLYNETRVAKDGNFVKQANTAGENLSALDSQVASNAQNINYLNGRVGELGDRINKVGAGAAALAALHPLDFDPDDKWDFAAGVGNYRNATAAAVGLFYRPNERTMFNLGWTMGDNRNMVNGGFSVKFGKSNKYVKYSKAEMASVIDNQSREIAELKAKDAQNAKDNAEMRAEIEALKKQVEALAVKK